MDIERPEVSTNVHPKNYTRALCVPEGYLFLLGDNAEESIDARYWAEPFVSVERVVAKVI